MHKLWSHASFKLQKYQHAVKLLLLIKRVSLSTHTKSCQLIWYGSFTKMLFYVEQCLGSSRTTKLSSVVIKIQWISITCGCADTPPNQNQNHWQLITLFQYHVWERNRLSDLSCFWKCYIHSFSHSTWRSEGPSGCRPGERDVHLFPAKENGSPPFLLESCHIDSTDRQTDRQDDLTDTLVCFMTSSFCQNKQN